MNIRYRVELSEAERAELDAMLGGGKHAVGLLTGAFSFLVGILVMKSIAETPCIERDQEGTLLQLTRGGGSTTTVRAQFCYRSDCSLIATQMNFAEKAQWSCK
jgi:hypothetical protein